MSDEEGGLRLPRPPEPQEFCDKCGQRLQTAPKLGEALYQKRMGLGLTLSQAAKKLDLDLSTYHRCEQGHLPKVVIAVKLARWLGKPLEEFFPT